MERTPGMILRTGGECPYCGYGKFLIPDGPVGPGTLVQCQDCKRFCEAKDAKVGGESDEDAPAKRSAAGRASPPSSR
jgi:hypothetical protein